MGPPQRFVVRREGGLWAYERALERAGLNPVAGAEEVAGQLDLVDRVVGVKPRLRGVAKPHLQEG